MNPKKSSAKEITIYDIADALDISPSTVSRSLKNHPSISDATIKKVNEQAKKMGYRSNIFAKNLRRQHTKTIGVIVPRLNSYFMSSALAGMEQIANEHGYNLIISQSFETSKKEASNVETMFKSRVDGLIISLAYNTTDLSHFDKLANKNIPIIFFDRVADYHSSINILIDNRKAGYQAAIHLLDQGCRRIIHITGNQARNVYKDRLMGYKKALEEYGIAFNANYVIENQLSDEDGKKAAYQIMKMNPRPDAVFVANDACAVSCMAAFKKNGLSIPGDIAIVGFNNDPVARYVQPKLTTIQYNGEEMGKVAAFNLINHLKENHHLDDLDATNTIILKSGLIIRGSSLKKEKA